MYSVLYVDDEAGLLEIGKLFLEQSGHFSVDTIVSAPAALALMKEKTYDAIISDYQMPVMDGIEFLRKVRASGNIIPFILFTGRGREEVVIQALNEGADFYLQKGGEPVSQFAELEHHVIQAVKRKQAENDLAKSEDKYRRIVDTADEGIWQMDEKFDTVYVNRRMAEMLGYTAEEMQGKNLLLFVAAEDLPDQAARLEERRQGKSGRYERRLVQKDGSIRWMQVSATPLMDPQGRFAGSFAMYSDITERKSAEMESARRNEDLQTAYEQLTVTEEELKQNYDELAKSQRLLQESEKQYRNVVEDQTEFISRFLPDGTHVFVNEAYCRYFGMQRDELLGHRFRPEIPVEDRERVDRFFASLTVDHPAGTIKHRVIMPDGTLRWHWWSDRAIFDLSGTVAEYQSVGRDITEEKITEIALEESKRRNAAMIAAMPDLLFVIARDGTCLDFQAADTNLLALPPSRIIGRNLFDAGFDEDAKKAVLHAISAAIETGALQQVEYKLSVPAGTSWFEARIVRLTADRVLGIVRDITARKAAEEEIRDACDKLEDRVNQRTADLSAANQMLEEEIETSRQIGSALKESEERFRTLIEKAPEAILVFDMDLDRYVEANAKAEQLFGCSRQQLFDAGPQQFYLPDQSDGRPFRETVPEHRRQVMEGAELVFERRIRNARGEDRVVEVRLVRLPSSTKRLIRSSYIDITDRKRVEELLRESEERYRTIVEQDYRSILENMQDIFYRTNRKGDLILVSPSGAALLGYAGTEEMIGRPAAEFYADPVQREAFLAALEKNQSVANREVTLKRKDGTPVTVSTSSHVYKDASGNYAGVEGILRDITPLKQAGEALRESESRYRSILDAIPDVVAITDLQGVIRQVSPAVQKIFGYGQEEIPGKPIVMFLVPEDRERAGANIALMHKGVFTGPGEYRALRADGSTLDIIANAEFVRDTAGNPTGMVFVVHDITERKRMEIALRENEGKYQSIIEALPDAVSVVDKDFHVTFANANLLSWLHEIGQNNDIIGKTILDAFPFLSSAVLDEYRTVFLKGKIIVTQESARIGDTEIVTETHKIPIEENGKVVAVLAIIRNITERKEAENALRASEDRYRHLIETTGTGYVILDTEGKVITANDEYVRLTGRSSLADITGKPVTEWTAPYDLTRNAAEVEQCLRKGRTWGFEIDYQKPDGTIQPIEINATVVSSANGLTILTLCRDITGRKRMDEALRESEDRFRKIFENSPLGMVLVTPDFRFFAVNPAWASMTGYSEKELLDMSFKDITHPEHLDSDLVHIQELAAGTIPAYNTEKRYIRKDGSILWGLVRIMSIRDQQGSLKYFAAQIENITERKAAEEALRESEARLRRAEEIGRSGSWEFRLNEGTVEASRGARLLYGLGETQWTIEKVQMIPLPGYRPLLNAALRDLIAGKSPYKSEFRIKRPSDGAVLDIQSVAEYDPERNVVFGVIHDITERKRAEAALRLSEEKFRGIFDTINDGIHIHEIMPDGKPGKFIEVNEAACRMLQYTREELLKFGPLDIVTEYHSRPFNDIIAELSATGQSIFETGHRRKDGTIVPVEINSHVVTLQGKKVGVTMIRDISERKRADEALRQVNRKLNLLSSVTRHDINNLLTLLQGYLHLMEKNRSEPAFAEYFGKVKTTVERISANITFTREYEEIGIKAPLWQDCRALVDMAVTKANVGKISVINDLPGGTEIFSDPLVEKVFSNLIDNALRHGGGNLTHIRFFSKKAGNTLILICEDDGAGISSGDKKRIFERGFGKNTGLGLFLSREILSITGITISETSKPGNGARFEMVVPKDMYRLAGVQEETGK
ncbi:PAS domain S-box protein [Methanoregula sp.]|uniref:PAS domain S-box protein n=1 Tax=Methanoregula sp. TaxID=2052170 RepID=UPI002D0060FE|nr:PAS domain S-box protein [Methanoregula sp.]HVP96788.1 PAS domain S-box protein [Methanoregula sp.]